MKAVEEGFRCLFTVYSYPPPPFLSLHPHLSSSHYFKFLVLFVSVFSGGCYLGLKHKNTLVSFIRGNLAL